MVADNDVDEFGRFGPRYEHVGGDGEVESVECGAPEDVLHGLVAQQPVDGFADFRLYESADRLVGLDGYVDRSPSLSRNSISLTSAGPHRRNSEAPGACGFRLCSGRVS